MSPDPDHDPPVLVSLSPAIAEPASTGTAVFDGGVVPGVVVVGVVWVVVGVVPVDVVAVGAVPVGAVPVGLVEVGAVPEPVLGVPPVPLGEVPGLPVGVAVPLVGLVGFAPAPPPRWWCLRRRITCVGRDQTIVTPERFRAITLTRTERPSSEDVSRKRPIVRPCT